MVFTAKVVAAIKNTHGMVYEHGAIAKVIYAASGLASDYVYGQVSSVVRSLDDSLSPVVELGETVTVILTM